MADCDLLDGPALEAAKAYVAARSKGEKGPNVFALAARAVIGRMPTDDELVAVVYPAARAGTAALDAAAREGLGWQREQHAYWRAFAAHLKTTP